MPFFFLVNAISPARLFPTPNRNVPGFGLVQWGELSAGILEYSAHLHDTPLPSDQPINATVMQRALVQLHIHREVHVTQPRRRVALFSLLTREWVLRAMPKPMFRDVTARLGLDYCHTTDPALAKRRAELVLPTGKITEHGPFAAGSLHLIKEPTDQ